MNCLRHSSKINIDSSCKNTKKQVQQDIKRKFFAAWHYSLLRDANKSNKIMNFINNPIKTLSLPHEAISEKPLISLYAFEIMENYTKKINYKGWLAISVIAGSLIIDQAIKIVVKTTMHYGESIHVTDWFHIYFVENPGMAFGMEVLPKPLLTIFRMLFVLIIIWLIHKLAKRDYKMGYIITISMIAAGALGNIIDSVFYGVIFGPSAFSEVSTFVPLGHGYNDWLHGKVVDMFYFPLFEFNWPTWIPFIGGDHFLFFSPIFNFADAVISCGMIILLLFYRKEFENTFGLVKEEIKKRGKSASRVVE